MLYKWTDFEMQDNIRRNKPASESYELRKKRSNAAKAAKVKIKEALAKGHKMCTTCNQELSLSSFDVDKKTFTGYSSWCKDCKKEYNKRYLKGNIDNDKTYRKQEGETT